MISFPMDSIIVGETEKGYPIGDRQFTSEQWREVYKTFFSNGVFLSDGTGFQVSPSDGMNVIVGPGKCHIDGVIGYERSFRELAVQPSTVADRIDTVVLRLNLNVEVRNIDLYVKTGVAQTVPVRPTLTRSETVWELGLADLFIAKETSAISLSRISDTRLDTARCGTVTPFARIDTTEFFDQMQSALDDYIAILDEQTDRAVELAQNALDGTTAGNLQSQIDANSAAIEEQSEAIDGLVELTNTVMVQTELSSITIQPNSSFYVPIDPPSGMWPISCHAEVADATNGVIMLGSPMYHHPTNSWYTRILNTSKVDNVINGILYAICTKIP